MTINLKRIQQEQQILQEYFPRRYVFVGMETTTPYLDLGLISNSKKAYRIKIVLPLDYPNSLPKVYIVYPKPLLGRDGKSLVDLGASHLMHLLSPSEGNVQVCHYKMDNWHANVTLYKVALKVRLWIEAYEGYLQTGNSLDFYLNS